jgi:hypothetical protein
MRWQHAGNADATEREGPCKPKTENTAAIDALKALKKNKGPEKTRPFFLALLPRAVYNESRESG